MDESLLALLCSPGSHAPLRLADPVELASINSLIQLGMLKNRNGSTLDAQLDGSLICESEGRCYPIRDGLPILIAGEAFDWPADQSRKKNEE